VCSATTCWCPLFLGPASVSAGTGGEARGAFSSLARANRYEAEFSLAGQGFVDGQRPLVVR
jgi:hypothetical protein